jgi:hypothetical protein
MSYRFSETAEPTKIWNLAVTHVCAIGACGKKKLGVDFQRLCPGQACGGTLGAMARVAPAGGTARSTEV